MVSSTSKQNHVARVIFLDIDGCLNRDDQMYRALPLEPRLMSAVGAAVNAANAQIVVSSAWRYGHTLADFQRMFAPHIAADRLVGVTPELPTRGREIEQWLLGRYPDGHVRLAILDDNDTGMFDMDPLRAWFVQTDPRRGVTPADLRRVRDLLAHGPLWSPTAQAA